jgi:TRAP transporter TAXI family solute receptor
MNVMDSLRQHYRLLTAGVIIIVLALLILTVVDSLPPRRFTILTGREEGAYYPMALAYQAIAAEKGFDVQIRTTSGSVETLELLEQGNAQIGFVQGGIALDADPIQLSTLASLFYEPVWVFYFPERFDGPLRHLTQLEGKRLAIGEEGSGANRLARKMLSANGIDESRITLIEQAPAVTAAGQRANEVDAVFLVSAPSAPVMQTLLADRRLQLMNFERAAAYPAQLPYLSTVVLPQGAIDLRGNYPAEETNLVATAANLVIRNDLHPDLVRLMTIAIVEVHESGGLFESRFEFPNFDHADLPIGREQRAYLERIRGGESALDNYLPFWAAALIDRYLLFVLPIAILLLPIISRSPILLTLYNRRKVTRWYKIVHSIDRWATHMSLAEIEQALTDLDAIEEQLQEKVSVSETFMANYYDLRGHIALVQARLRRKQARLANAGNNPNEMGENGKAEQEDYELPMV